MAGKKWTESEKILLTHLWGLTMTVGEIVAHFPDRTPTSIRVAAKRLHLRHTKEHTSALLSKLAMGSKNGMFGKQGPRNGVSLSDTERKHLSGLAKEGYVLGTRKRRIGKDNHRYGKPGTMLGRTLSDDAKVILSQKAHQRWTFANQEAKDLKIAQLQKGRLAVEGFPTKIEIAVERLLQDMGLSYKTQVPWGYYVVDFVLCGSIVLECYGDYWHANPNRYIDPVRWTHAQKKNTQRDIAKKSFFQNRNVPFLVLWESDIHKRLDWCRQQILEVCRDL